MKQILCIAEVCCDIIFGQLNKIPILGEEEYCKYFSVKAGGGANTAMGLARLKVPTKLLTRIGDDEIGHIVMENLFKSGLDISQVVMKKGVGTPVSAVMSTKEDRCFASFSGDQSPFVTIDQLEQAIKETDHVHTYLGYCLHYPIVEICKKYNKTLSVDTSWMDGADLKGIEPILSYCSLFTPNDKEAMALTGMGCPESALLHLSKLVQGVVITMGEQGSIALMNDKIHRQKSVVYGEAVDSTGAGDLFCSGLLYGFVNGFNLEKSIEIASHTAGLSVTYYGGIDDKFTIEIFEKMLS
jgi:sugar/nucleoside kinase (ribokinase family)